MRRFATAACIAASMPACALLIDLQERDLAADDGSIGGEGSTTDAPVGDASDADTTCDANIEIDPRNCGRCGHDCAGGSCEAGACALQTLTNQPTNPTAIAVLNNDVYWVESGDLFSDGGAPPGEVWKMSKSGGAPSQIYVDLAGLPVNALATNDTTPFWVTGSAGFTIYSPAGAMCFVPPAVQVAGALAAATDRLYVLQRSGAMWGCFMDGGFFDPQVSKAVSVATWQSAMVFSELAQYQNAILDYCPSGLSSDTQACETSWATLPVRSGEFPVALTSGRAYWTSPDAPNALFFRATAADASTTISAVGFAGNSPTVVVADDTRAFASAPDPDGAAPGPVLSFDCSGATCSPPSTLVEDYVTAVALDDLAVYLAVSRPSTDGGTSGAILKIAKP